MQEQVPINGLPRDVAQRLVDRVTTQIDQYLAVRHDDAQQLLGDVRFAAIMRDRLRRLGPLPNYVYPWNVVDYLDSCGPGVKALNDFLQNERIPHGQAHH